MKKDKEIYFPIPKSTLGFVIKRRQIENINEQRIRVSMGRNGLSGITSCQANAIVKWKDAANPTEDIEGR